MKLSKSEIEMLIDAIDIRMGTIAKNLIRQKLLAETRTKRDEPPVHFEKLLHDSSEYITDLSELKDKLENEIQYEENKLEVCAYGKAELYYIEELYERLHQVNEQIEILESEEEGGEE